VDLDIVEPSVRRASRPSAAQQGHLVTGAGESPEDLVHVDLGAARLRILTVLPVDEQNPH
jgi:hypothetical protein